jgi:hypothetical protein
LRLGFFVRPPDREGVERPRRRCAEQALKTALFRDKRFCPSAKDKGYLLMHSVKDATMSMRGRRVAVKRLDVTKIGEVTKRR